MIFNWCMFLTITFEHCSNEHTIFDQLLRLKGLSKLSDKSTPKCTQIYLQADKASHNLLCILKIAKVHNKKQFTGWMPGLRDVLSVWCDYGCELARCDEI